MKNISFLVLFTLTIFLILPLFAHAGIVPCGQSTDDPSTTGYSETDPCTLCHLFVGISNIIHFLTYDIALPASVIGFIVGGFFILTAAGSEEKLKKGKSAVTATVIGLVLVFGAWLIMDLILGNLVAPGYMPWNTFPSISQCSYTMNVAGPGPQAPVTCASFTYSNFGPCQPNNTQYRSVVSALPSGCTGGTTVLSQQCNYIAPIVSPTPGSFSLCSYTYSDWTPKPCTTGTQTRTASPPSPAVCIGAPLLTRTCPTTPFQIMPNSITIDQSNPAQFLIATFIDSNGNESDVSAGVTWSSSDSNIVMVNSDKTVSAGPQNGTANITGTYTDPTDGYSYTKTINVIVNAPRYSCISSECKINQTDTSITQYSELSACQQVCVQSPGGTGGTGQAYLEITPDELTISSQSSYMSCTAGGPCSSCTSQGGWCSKTGQSSSLNAYFHDSSGGNTNVTNSAIWSSNNPNLVYLSSPGQVIAGEKNANGFVYIKAKYDGKEGFAEITVKP